MDTFQPSYPATLWVGRFGVHLMARLPSMEVVDAVKRAVAIWPYAAHLEPEAAADILHSRLARYQRKQRERNALTAFFHS